MNDKLSGRSLRMAQMSTRCGALRAKRRLSSRSVHGANCLAGAQSAGDDHDASWESLGVGGAGLGLLTRSHRVPMATVAPRLLAQAH